MISTYSLWVRNILQNIMYLIVCTSPSSKSNIYDLAPASLEQFLRAILDDVSLL